MTHSGVSQAVELVRGRFREGLIRPRAGWKRAAETVWGPLLTLAVLIVLDLLARAGTPLAEPFPLLLLTVAISGYLGGLRTALISAVGTVVYAVHFLAEPGMPLDCASASWTSSASRRRTSFRAYSLSQAGL